MPPAPPSSTDRCYALVPCAGVGARAATAGPKQYAPLAGAAVVARTLAALARVPRLAATLVVLAPGDHDFERHAPGHDGEGRWTARCGGATRAATVAAGLAELARRGAADSDWVLVHDAARCLVEPADIDRLIDACAGDAVGGLLAVPLADTLKQAQPASRAEAAAGAASGALRTPAHGHAAPAPRVAATVDRAGKWAAQTPQMFRLGLLRSALAAAGDAVTDEAGAVEALGLAPLLVAGSLANLKLTWPADFLLAERLVAGAPVGSGDASEGLHPY